jgi:outer membrane protein TolC
VFNIVRSPASQPYFFSTVLMICMTLLAGCHPTQPSYFCEGDPLAHYLDQATDVEYPDVYQARLEEVDQAGAPITLSNAQVGESWDITLEETISIALKNSKVVRNLGSVTPFGFADGLTGRTVGSATVYDPAVFETDPTAGVAAALANFDAAFTTSVFWQKTDRPQNVDSTSFGFVPFFFQQDLGQMDMALSKQTASGTLFTLRNQTIYDRNNRGFGRALPSDWFTAMEFEATQPLLRGRGAQVNRIPIMLARINTDVSLASFESSVRNLIMDIENTYWDLHYAYRNLETTKIARDSAQVTWKIAYAKFKGKVETIQAESQAKEQYFFFRSQVEAAWRDLLNTENRLRWLMGLAATDGRILRPVDEPIQARVQFEWQDVHAESLIRSAELRQQKWAIQRRELELIAARNRLLPELNVVGLYRWLGLGDDLIEANRRGFNFVQPGSLAWDELTEGNFQEVRLGLDFTPPKFGARQEMAGVRNAQLQLVREKARLEDMELNTSHLLTVAMRNLDSNYELAESHFNRWAASQAEVNSAEALYTGGKATLDLVLEAQRRRAQAQVDYYRALIDHTKSIADVHFRKGSLLEYCNVRLAEGPWPQKAYWDAWGHARRRAASRQLDYGWTRPRVISRGALPQEAAEIQSEEVTLPEGEPLEAAEPVLVPEVPLNVDPPAKPQKQESILKSQPVSAAPIGTGVESPVVKQVDYQRKASEPAATLQDPVVSDWEEDRVQAISSPSAR